MQTIRSDSTKLHRNDRKIERIEIYSTRCLQMWRHLSFFHSRHLFVYSHYDFISSYGSYGPPEGRSLLDRLGPVRIVWSNSVRKQCSGIFHGVVPLLFSCGTQSNNARASQRPIFHRKFFSAVFPHSNNNPQNAYNLLFFCLFLPILSLRCATFCISK